MLKLGLTGGIGSGKSTVAKVFETLGIPVYYADNAARRIMNENEQLKQDIIKHFGAESYINNMLNRPFISRQVFNNKEKLALLNSLVHPATIRDSEQWMQLQKTPYTIKEAALIFESGMQQYLDYIIGVSAPEELRIERTIKRDGINREEVVSRIKNQVDEEKKISLCDFIIYNDEQQAILPQVIELHGQLLKLTKKDKKKKR
jgi:dephospho-CoA kinase